MNSAGIRPVVVNSLLCFLKNYREQPNIMQIIDQYFTLETRRLSYQILLELLSEADKLAVASSQCTPSLLDLFDRVIQSDSLIPIFATDDLTVLPLSLNYDDNMEQPKDLYNEVRQLRLYVHALGQKAYSPLWKRHNASFDFVSSAQNASFIKPPIKPHQKQPMMSTDFNVTSLLKDDRQCSPSSSTSSEHNSVSSIQMCSQQNRLTNKPQSHNGNRLDELVQKLNDRLNKSENNNNEECNFEDNSDRQDEAIVRESNNNTIASTFGASATAMFTAQFIQHVAKQAYENSKRNAASQLDDLQNEDNADTDREFGQDNEKTSSQSSPTPSDFSMNPDYGIDSANDADKPYVCPQSNCRKRFSNKFLLKKHQFIHTGLRPHACPFCAKQFNRKDNLLRHKKTHLNNAIAQMNGRKRHNALSGVVVNEDNFQLFHQVNHLLDRQSNEFSFASRDQAED